MYDNMIVIFHQSQFILSLIYPGKHTFPELMHLGTGYTLIGLRKKYLRYLHPRNYCLLLNRYDAILFVNSQNVKYVTFL